uniref:Uncharacterized protein n=1 Tax=Sphaerodactylus townsendi TaxID=933632 RepID=A0ACB8FUK3_9SAUR
MRNWMAERKTKMPMIQYVGDKEGPVVTFLNNGGSFETFTCIRNVISKVLSFLAFVLEEVIEVCTNCSGLYFFEFVSCSAFLLCIPILAMYCTPLYEKVEKRQVKNLDFGIVSLVGLFFWIASIVFSSTYDKTPIEIAAVTFGYFASIAFTVDFVMILYKRCHARKETPPENTARLPNLAENQPLNNPPA